MSSSSRIVSLRVVTRASFVSLCVTGAAALAQPAAVLDPVAVTASRAPQRLIDVLADLTLIGPEEIRRSGVHSLAELLQRQPGVEIIQNGGPGATSGVFLRGANAAQTLVLVDGLRVASSTSGATALEAIPLEQIERIEILRGPSSSLYGADAIGGVIQVFTRAGSSTPQANASAGYGTHDTSLFTAGVSGGSGAFRGSLQVGARRSAGFNAIVNPQNFSYDPDRDGYRDDSVNAQASLTLAEDHEVSAQYFRSRLDNQFDAGDAFDDRTITTLTAWQLALRDRFTTAWQSRLSAGEGSDDSLSRTAFGDSPFRTRQRQYTWQNDVALESLGLAGRLTLALERREERVDTEPAFAVRTRDTDSVTAVYSVMSGPHALQANVRNDHSSQFGNRTTGALAYGFRITPQWRVTASAGTAFKAPTFNDLYFPGFSNPDLRPETARNVELGAYYATALGAARIEARAVAWHNRVRDLIVFQCDASFNCAPANVSNATLEGVTLGVDAFAGATTLRASLDLQSPEDDASGRLLPRRARRHGSLVWLQQVGPATVSAEWIASSRRYDDAANLRPLGGYAILNLTLEWPVTRSVTLFARADNVFDRDYALAADFSTGGARLFAGARWQL
jgi:vitamin B12 transporter